jgi:hypothetical protein
MTMQRLHYCGPVCALRETGTTDASGCFTVDFARQVFGLPLGRVCVSEQKEGI